MGNLLYLIAVILIIVWVFGAFVSPFGGGLIHILLVIAIIAVLLSRALKSPF
ncbi:MAG: lmo0937 family membrane protein [Bacteroidetes bacterium]|nr:lmo0937 family membrane protein [Bacteroidota bacterium]MBU1372807.1 lmo0937 family membrane protein [Bacteroidota bacterium]MBU1485003.1 lmo0937 family membrane protein [Bacteroidota bacterium]MBU1761782.1 lmo0937 family membrane protein [Bacteroidota bacterium]MBU2266968.1 lmo0937 family membrane protein [Bacteroidota bacterium]